MNPSTTDQRLHALDAVRGFALLLGVAFHAALSFLMPTGTWAMTDVSPAPGLGDAAFVAHMFRMSLFFFIAGYFGRLLFAKLGARGFWANRAKRIGIPFVVGWVILCPTILFLWGVGMNKVFHGAPPPMPAAVQAALNAPGAFPLMHLWFLYLLSLFYVATVAARAVLVRFDGEGKFRCFVDRVITSGISSGAAVFTFGIPLALALLSLPFWFFALGIPTPDSSLIPQLPASVGFGTAFVIGWLVNRSPEALAMISRRWLVHLSLALSATAVLIVVMHRQPIMEPGFSRNALTYLYGVAVWAWVFGLTGAALRFLSNYSPVRRYIADASYWIYLTHLPVIIALQIWVGHWPVHWALKYPFILIVGFGALFVSYHWLVRPTFVGQLLNGRRVKRVAQLPAIPSAAPTRVVDTTVATRAPVASLRGAVKKYGAVTALAGIDLDVRRGELLAVLGPNGAGKSTAISLWLGLIEPDAGEVMLCGGSPTDVERRRELGVMMQDVELVKELRVRELVTLASSYYPNALPLEETLRFCGITALAGRLYGKLSGGQKRQVQFAMAICGRPRVLFLDEPTVGLDVQAREALWVNIRTLLAQGCSVVLTTHYLEEAEALATRVAVLAKGRVIAQGSVDDMRALVARRQVTCETTLVPADVRDWTGVVDASLDRGRLSITATDAESVVRRLLSTDAGLKRLEVREAGLNEAFTELTREAA
jgi:ABC-type multidrug transport system ATPase subunit/peptidoglycan/LPS O-acetylase OafA/YrhL